MATKKPTTAQQLVTIIANIAKLQASVEKLSSVTPPSPVSNSNKLYVNKNSQLKQYLASHLNDRNFDKLAMVASQPTAVWLVGGTEDQVEKQIRDTMKDANGDLVTFVVYNIPVRDNNGQSAGGAKDEAAYYSWLGRIDAVLDSLGNPHVTLIVEPDAIGFAIQQNDFKRTEWLSIGASQILGKHPNRDIYLDVAMWCDMSSDAGIQAGAKSVADRIKFMREKQGLGTNVHAYCLNTSGFLKDEPIHKFGEALIAALGGGTYITDTSRNGGTTAPGVWQNPIGWKIGALPLTQARTASFDGNLWIKPAGESDGNRINSTGNDGTAGAPNAGDLFIEQLISAIN